MNREYLEELAALRALGLLEPEQDKELQAHLRDNPADRQVLELFAGSENDVALSVEQVAPPPELKARVLAALPARRAAAQPTGAAHAVHRQAAQPAASKVVLLRWVPWALAASLALVCGLLVQSNLELRTEVATLERQSAVDDLHIAVLSSMLQSAPEATAVAVWDEERQEGVLRVENLPPLPADKDYQLWVVDPNYGSPVDGGVFDTGPDGSVSHKFQPKDSISVVNAFAVSLERKGGVPVAEGPMVLLTKGK